MAEDTTDLSAVELATELTHHTHTRSRCVDTFERKTLE